MKNILVGGGISKYRGIIMTKDKPVRNLLYSVSMKSYLGTGITRTDMIALLSGLNMLLGYVNGLNFFAELLLVSAASIEIYASKKRETYEI